MSEATSWMSRFTSLRKTEDETCKQIHHSLSWWVKEWGLELCNAAVARNDLVEDDDGLFYERSKGLVRKINREDTVNSKVEQ
eukprot:7130581-Pyramimonas_sp.AAC.1